MYMFFVQDITLC